MRGHSISESDSNANEVVSPPKRHTRSRPPLTMEMATATTSNNAPIQPEQPTNPMKASLDYGDLKPSSADKTFTSFLDIRPKYHKEFMRVLRKYVQREGYVGDVLVNDEGARRRCAMGFLGKVGMVYWGSEEGRKKFLIPERLESTNRDGLAVYPEREDEIARTIMILLEKKGKREWKSEKNALTTDTESKRPHTPPPNHREGIAAGIRYTPGSKVHDTPGSAEKKKKKKLKPSRPLTGHASPFDYRLTEGAVRPFSSITATMCAEPDGSSRKRKRKDRESSIDLADMDDIFGPWHDDPVPHDAAKDVSQLDSVKNKTGLDDKTREQDHSEAENKANEHKTKFLVSATNQHDMAPVWIPYQHFESASSFLAAMADECGVEEWGPEAQLNLEAHATNATIRPFSPAQRVSVASVSFEWAEFAIRVRAGKDRDWAMVMDGLKRAWEKEIAEEYRVDVMLHVGG